MQLNNEYVDSVNQTMKSVNNLTDELYESLIDKEFDHLYDATTMLIQLLQKIQKESIPENKIKKFSQEYQK